MSRELTLEMLDSLISYSCPDCWNGLVFNHGGFETCPLCDGKWMSKENKERRKSNDL